MSNSKNCQSVRGMLMLYLDSELDATATLSVNQHLVRCPECRERFEAEQLIESAIAGGLQTGEDMPEDVWGRLTDSLASEVSGALESEAGRVAPGSTRARPSSPGQSFRGLAWLAAAAMLVAAITLWNLDSGVLGEARNGDLVHQLAALHRAPAAPADGDPALVARALLSDMSLPASLLPAAALESSVAGHAVSLVSAERVQVADVAALNLRYDCCGVPTSVFLIPRGDDATLPAEFDDFAYDGLITRALLSGGVIVSVVSEHAVVLGDAWSS